MHVGVTGCVYRGLLAPHHKHTNAFNRQFLLATYALSMSCYIETKRGLHVTTT